MFHNLTRLALGAALVAGTLSAQYREEIYQGIPSEPALGGIEAHVAGTNSSNQTVIGFTAYSGTWAFGNGTIVSVPHASTATVAYDHSGILFELVPLGWWAYWCAGGCEAEFYVSRL